RTDLVGRLLVREPGLPGRSPGQAIARGDVLHLLLPERREDPPRADRVARHFRRGGLQRDDLREADHAVLRRDVSGLVDRADEAVRRGNVDDPSPVPPAQPWQGGPRAWQVCRPVDREIGGRPRPPAYHCPTATRRFSITEELMRPAAARRRYR